MKPIRFIIKTIAFIIIIIISFMIGRIKCL